MGLVDDKKDVFNEIKAFTSIKDDLVKIPDETTSFSSVNNSKEIIPFLLDLLTALIGTEVLERAIGELMTGFVRSVEPTLKTTLKKQTIGYNSDVPLSDVGFDAGTGYSIPVKDVDSARKLNTDKAAEGGDLLYSADLNTFDNKSRDAIVAAGTDVTTSNVTTNYNEALDTFTFKPSNPSQTVGDFTNDYIDGLTLIDEKEFTTTIMDTMFGTISTSQNKTQQQLLFEEKLKKTLQKAINEESLAITDDELAELDSLALQKKNGVTTVDVGCGILESSVSIDELRDMLSITTGSTDPLTVGNAYSNTMLGGFGNSQNTANENDLTIKDGFFKKLIDAIVLVLVGAITITPQIRALFAITGGFKNNGVPDLGDAIDDISKYGDMIACLSDEAKAAINEFIFNMVKKELMDLVVPVSKHILKEKINSYLRILKSLIPFKL